MARTHDISLGDYQVKDLATFGNYLTQAADAAFPKGQSRYTRIHVLLLSWEQDNLGVIDEIVELQHLLRETFLYDTEEWKIPSSHSYKALRKRINIWTISRTRRLCLSYIMEASMSTNVILRVQGLLPVRILSKLSPFEKSLVMRAL